jgi:hypothetical protein
MLVLALMRVFAYQTFLALGAAWNKRPVRFWYMRSPAVAENGAALALTPASRRARLDLMRAHFFTSGVHIGR